MRVDAFSPGAQERTIAGVEPSSRADCGSVAKGPLDRPLAVATGAGVWHGSVLVEVLGGSQIG